jgi:hypothetical protein
MRYAYKILVRKRPLGRHRPRRENNIKMDTGETADDNVDRVHLFTIETNGGPL